MIQIFVIATGMGFFSLMFLLFVKSIVDIPDAKLFNYFLIPVGCILSLIIIILGVCGILEFM